MKDRDNELDGGVADMDNDVDVKVADLDNLTDDELDDTCTSRWRMVRNARVTRLEGLQACRGYTKKVMKKRYKRI